MPFTFTIFRKCLHNCVKDLKGDAFLKTAFAALENRLKMMLSVCSELKCGPCSPPLS